MSTTADPDHTGKSGCSGITVPWCVKATPSVVLAWSQPPGPLFWSECR
ncbi:Uncharacterised protein [Mycobacteroides abscessus]|nr:Uncharacterised protein [Mycobacteroides abscessus]